jgi:hypothetical protein
MLLATATCLGVWFISVGATAAQEQPIPIASGETISGELEGTDPSEDGAFDAYGFSARTGDRVPLTMRGEGLYPELLVGRLDDAGRFSVLENAQDGSFISMERQTEIVFLVPEAGDYVVRATSQLNNEGPYTLTMGTIVAAPSTLVPRSMSSATLAARTGDDFAAFTSLLDREVADCERAPTWAGDCYELLMAAAGIPRGMTEQWGDVNLLSPEGAATTESYARRAVDVARAAFTNTRRAAWGVTVVESPDYRIPNAEHALAVHLLRPIADRPQIAAARAGEAERLIRTAYDAAAVHDRLMGRLNLWNMDWLEHLAVALSVQGRQAEANAVLNERLVEAERTWGREHGRLYQYLPELARGQMAGGDMVAAVATWKRALELAAVDGGVSRSELLDLESGLAGALTASGDVEAGLAAYAAIHSELTSGPNAFQKKVEGYVFGYLAALNSAGRKAEASDFLVQEARRMQIYDAPMTERTELVFIAAMYFLHWGEAANSRDLLLSIVSAVEGIAGPGSQMALRVQTLLTLAQARSGAVDQVQGRIDVLLPAWRARAEGNPVLFAAALAMFGDLRVAGGRVDEGRTLLTQALPLELARWCPSHEDRRARMGRYDWDQPDARCQGHPTLTTATRLLASASLRSGQHARAATRVYAHAGDMVIGRTRARYSLSSEARREYSRFRGVHGNFVSTAWASLDDAVANELERRVWNDDGSILTVSETLVALTTTRLKTTMNAIPII